MATWAKETLNATLSSDHSGIKRSLKSMPKSQCTLCCTSIQVSAVFKTRQSRLLFFNVLLLFYFSHYCCSLFALSLLSLTNWDNKGQEKCLYAARVSFLRVVILHLMHFRKGTFSVRFQPCWWRRKMCLKLFTSGQNIFAVHVGTEPSFSFQRQLTCLAHTLLDIIQSHECNENVSFQASG